MWTNLGLCYERVGAVNFFKTDWKIIVSVKIDKFIQDHEIREQIGALTQQCLQMREEQSCERIVSLKALKDIY